MNKINEKCPASYLIDKQFDDSLSDYNWVSFYRKLFRAMQFLIKIRYFDFVHTYTYFN